MKHLTHDGKATVAPPAPGTLFAPSPSKPCYRLGTAETWDRGPGDSMGRRTTWYLRAGSQLVPGRLGATPGQHVKGSSIALAPAWATGPDFPGRAMAQALVKGSPSE